MSTLSDYAVDFPQIASKSIDCQLKSTSTVDNEPINTFSAPNTHSSLKKPESQLFSTPTADLHHLIEIETKSKSQKSTQNLSSSGECASRQSCLQPQSTAKQLKQTKGPLARKYKNKLCFKFHNEGKCQYGDGCYYTHYEFKLEKEETDSVVDILSENYEIVREYNIKFRRESRVLKLLTEDMK